MHVVARNRLPFGFEDRFLAWAIVFWSSACAAYYFPHQSVIVGIVFLIVAGGLLYTIAVDNKDCPIKFIIAAVLLVYGIHLVIFAPVVLTLFVR